METTRTWVLSEVYHPETEGTAYFVTEIAESLASESRHEVRVVCSQPCYSAAGQRAPKDEVRGKVGIHRCFSTCWNRQRVLCRLVNMLSFSVSVFVYLLWHVRRSDRLFTVTNPPLVPLIACVVCVLKRAELTVYVHDVYPEIAVLAGVLRRDGVIARTWKAANKAVYRKATRTIVVARDMKHHLVNEYGLSPCRVSLIPEFVDCDDILPTPRNENPILATNGLLGRFVVLIAGNLGPVHDVATLLEVAKSIEDLPQVTFLVIGSGKKYLWLREAIAEQKVSNVVMLPRMPRSDSCAIMNACDIAVAALFVPGMFGLAFPARTLACLAAGKPIVVVADKASESVQMVIEGGFGWWVPPKDADALANVIRTAFAQQDALPVMSVHARRAAVANYSREVVLRQMNSTLTRRSSSPEKSYETDV